MGKDTEALNLRKSSTLRSHKEWRGVGRREGWEWAGKDRLWKAQPLRGALFRAPPLK